MVRRRRGSFLFKDKAMKEEETARGRGGWGGGGGGGGGEGGDEDEIAQRGRHSKRELLRLRSGKRLESQVS